MRYRPNPTAPKVREKAKGFRRRSAVRRISPAAAAPAA